MNDIVSVVFEISLELWFNVLIKEKSIQHVVLL